MRLELILKDIRDRWTKENFFRIERFIREQVILDGQFKFYNVEIDRAITELKIPHQLDFVPIDIIDLAVQGDHNYYFVHEKFDQTNMVVTTQGPVKLRFLAGRFPGTGFAGNNSFTLVPPAVGAQGPAGSAGPQGDAGNVINDQPCDSGIAVGDVVRVDSGTGIVVRPRAINS